MNTSLNTSTNPGSESRRKREAKEHVCTGAEYGSIVAETIAELVADVNSIPIVGEMIQIVTGKIAAVGHITKGGLDIIKTAMGCDEMLMEELKETMETKFNEVDRKMDQQAVALAKVSSMVSKTLETVEKVRIEMNEGFNKVVYAIENIDVRQRVSQIHNVVEYFLKEKSRFKKLSKESYIAKLEEEDGILKHLKESRTPRDDTLHTALYYIINNDLAVPKTEKDLKALQALYALFYGAQTYVSIFVFLMQANSHLADYYYQKGDYAKFNNQIDTIKTVFNDFKSSILGEDGNGLLSKVDNILVQVKNKEFIENIRHLAIYREVVVRSKTIGKLITEIKKMTLPIIEDIPEKVTIKFKTPDINIPFGGWKSGVSVKYAVQYEKKGIYSKLSDWSEPLEINTKACPYVKVSIGSGGRNRLIFRQFNNDKTELVSILTGSKSEFRDINRDLYNAAGTANKEEGLQLATECIENGANIKAIFELGKTILHNAAKSGNVKIMKLLIEKGFPNVNVNDRQGYSPIHIAAISGNPGFLSEIVKKGGNVNAVTTLNHYTPLHLGAQKGYKSVIEELVQQADVDINLKDKHGFAPLHYAVNGGTEAVSGFYKGSNVDFNIKSDAGLTPAHLAAINKKFSVIEELKSKFNFNVNALDVNNMTPLHFAAMMGHFNMVKSMINLEGLDLNVTARRNNWTALHYAIYFDHRGTAIELIKSPKVNINVKATGRVTPLHMATGLGQLSVVKELLDKKVKTEMRLPQGHTALHLSAINDDLSVAKELLDKGVNIEALVANCLTLVDFAEFHKSKRILRYLKSTNVDSETLYNKIKRAGTNTCSFYPVPDEFERSMRYGMAAVNKLDNSFKHQKLMGNGNSFESFNGLINLFDSNGTLLLLDVLLRKLTKTKFDVPLDAINSEFDAQAKALNITEEFEEALNTFIDGPIVEQIDFSEVYLRVKKALLSGRNNHVTQIMCSYVDKLSLLKTGEKDHIMKSLLSTKPTVRNYNKQASEDLIVLLEKTCSV